MSEHNPDSQSNNSLVESLPNNELPIQTPIKNTDDPNQLQQKQDGSAIKNDTSKQQDLQKFEKLYLEIKSLIAFKMMKTDNIPAEIIDNLYLGSIGAALSKASLQKIGITNIVSALDKFNPPFQDIFEYKVIKLADSLNQNIIDYFDESNKYIDNCLNNGKKVLVHCYAGKSRSSTLICAYLIWKKQMRRNQALDLMRVKRPIVQPNLNFCNQLLKYENQLLGEQTEEEKQKEIEEKENKIQEQFLGENNSNINSKEEQKNESLDNLQTDNKKNQENIAQDLKQIIENQPEQQIESENQESQVLEIQQNHNEIQDSEILQKNYEDKQDNNQENIKIDQQTDIQEKKEENQNQPEQIVQVDNEQIDDKKDDEQSIFKEDEEQKQQYEVHQVEQIQLDANNNNQEPQKNLQESYKKESFQKQQEQNDGNEPQN